MKYLMIASVLALSACVSVGKPKEGKELFVLKADSHGSLAHIRIAEPVAGPGLENRRIAVQDSPNHLTYYNDVAWVDRVPDMFGAFMADALGASSERDMLPARRIIHIRISEFQVNNQMMPPVAQLRLQVHVTGPHGQKIVRRFTVKKYVTAEENHLPAIIEAFNKAANQAAMEIRKKIR